MVKSPESVAHLFSKCHPYAENWAPVADELWKENRRLKKEKEQAEEEIEH